MAEMVEVFIFIIPEISLFIEVLIVYVIVKWLHLIGIILWWTCLSGGYWSFGMVVVVLALLGIVVVEAP